MGIFDSILGGDKNISLGTTSSGTGGGKQDDNQSSIGKKVVPVIEEMTLIDTSIGEESDLPKDNSSVNIELTPSVTSFNENQSIDIGGSSNVITETTSLIEENSSGVQQDNQISNPVLIPPSNNVSQQLESSQDSENVDAMFSGTTIDLVPEPVKIIEPLPGQDAWSEESSIHTHSNAEILQASQDSTSLELDIPASLDTITPFSQKEEKGETQNTEAITSELSATDSSANFFNSFSQEEEKGETQNTEAITSELSATDSSANFFNSFSQEEEKRETQSGIPVGENHITPEIPSPIVSIVGINLNNEPLINKTDITSSDIPNPANIVINGSVQDEKDFTDENPKDILKNTIEQLKDLRANKNQLLKEAKKEAEDFKESAKKMHDNETKTRILIKDIEAEIIRIGELIEVCYTQMKEGVEKKTLPINQKRVKGKLVKTQNKNIKKTTV